MERSYLIDTNVIIDWLAGKFQANQQNFLNDVINQTPTISVITKIELLGFNTSKNHEELLRNFINDSLIINLSDQIVNECIRIRKSSKIKLPDALIASTAITFNSILLTRNTSYFSSLKRLEIINPHLI
ncbi:type II toxin-antitoxin system VapC family toxin [Algoriphagus sp. NG3]|uniref:type II toxin-antitoxin system VapC family toxin n=1 Tax=Algoriphagus sp. NG3 TaxID=3097546 RepID=UPI002A8373F6|nr:type II toxin-antitoxin system VapC family toxin [Algoriphagus sp. NG3]WPR76400.1 type II toxin-antitoxin system VapC family toxin [Algoriphagus sp. NG3]